MLLTPEAASEIVGVPAVQLERWAWNRTGPKNVGTRWKPKYTEDDLREWRESQNDGRQTRC